MNIFNNKGFFNFGGGYGSSSKKTEQAKPEWAQAPDYPESKAARAKWWDILQQFAEEPGYGAIQPDWASIWKNAQNKVSQFFWGSPTDPGVVGKIKASAARRNVSESPALTNMLARMGATEANVLSDMAVKQATKQAELGESGRLSLLQNLAGLTQMKPQGTFWTPWTKGSSSGWSVEGLVGKKQGA